MARQLTEEQKKELAILKANHEMLEKTKEQCKLRKRETSIKLIEGAQEEVREHVAMAGATMDDLKSIEFKEAKNVEKEEEVVIKQLDSSEQWKTVTPVENNSTYKLDINDIDLDIQYDVLPLPSNGEPYKSKKSRLPIAYLTAADENIITSPNLYRDGTILDVLLKRKIMDKEVDSDLLCKGDRDAIILWLRATGYGVEFPITVKDPKTGVEFDTSIDLSTIKTKPFSLKADEEGLFEFETPIRKDKIKFKFFNRLDEKKLIELDKKDLSNSTKHNLTRIVGELKNELVSSDNIPESERTKIISSIEVVEMWSNKIPSTSNLPINKSVTNGMELAIVSVNENRDRDFIKNYIKQMPALDAFKFRKFMSDNEPSLDFKIKVERPESLGGGSFETFLEIDYSLFLNISQL